MASRDLPHIIVPPPRAAEPFTTTAVGRGNDRPRFTGDRLKHGQRLRQEFDAAVSNVPDLDEPQGSYVTFVSSPELQLALDTLSAQGIGELVAVREYGDSDGLTIEATVFIPTGKKKFFQERLGKYLNSVDKEKASYSRLIEGIQAIKRATIRELWTDPDELFPGDLSARVWWEVWLRKDSGAERRRFSSLAERHQLKTSSQFLGFGDRTVVLLEATADQLADFFQSIDDIAELRKPHEIVSFLPDLYASDQREWVDELTARLHEAPQGSPVVCILDRGVQSSHPLLTSSIGIQDLHVANSAWKHDPVIYEHGTEMAGLALFGDLSGAIKASQEIHLGHRLESVKILPDTGENDPDLYGAVTARGVDQPEISAMETRRVFMLAVSTESNAQPDGNANNTQGAGKPTSWSASIDALAFGRAVDDTNPTFTYLDRDEERHPRLFVISAGNIRDVRPEDNHLDRSDAEPVEDPAQAWNALTVGAYSEHDDMAGADEIFQGYSPIAARGDLAPVSRTSVSIDRDKWPFKPEVVASGGNHALSPQGTTVDTPPNLGLLTTRLQRLGGGFFTTTRDTSAATAQVAAVAADILAAYPELKPETVRALIVHSAQWTDTMRQHFDPTHNKGDLATMLRRYGMGVPNLERAIHSASDALTLISEASLRPFERKGATTIGRTREMNLHRLPWPAAQLSELGDTQVEMRVTLSYFVEPNPSSRGWAGRYAYPSHGLRFAMKRADESIEDFRKRHNKRDRNDGESLVKKNTEKGWLFGSDQQKKPGSLHTDIWTGTAEDLASKGAIMVYPVAGWWKDRPLLDQSPKSVDYSLVVSIESPEVDIDLWTPVMQQISTVIEI